MTEGQGRWVREWRLGRIGNRRLRRKVEVAKSRSEAARTLVEAIESWPRVESEDEYAMFELGLLAREQFGKGRSVKALFPDTASGRSVFNRALLSCWQHGWDDLVLRLVDKAPAYLLRSSMEEELGDSVFGLAGVLAHEVEEAGPDYRHAEEGLEGRDAKQAFGRVVPIECDWPRMDIYHRHLDHLLTFGDPSSPTVRDEFRVLLRGRSVGAGRARWNPFILARLIQTAGGDPAPVAERILGEGNLDDQDVREGLDRVASLPGEVIARRFTEAVAAGPDAIARVLVEILISRGADHSLSVGAGEWTESEIKRVLEWSMRRVAWMGDGDERGAKHPGWVTMSLSMGGGWDDAADYETPGRPYDAVPRGIELEELHEEWDSNLRDVDFRTMLDSAWRPVEEAAFYFGTEFIRAVGDELAESDSHLFWYCRIEDDDYRTSFQETKLSKHSAAATAKPARIKGRQVISGYGEVTRNDSGVEEQVAPEGRPLVQRGAWLRSPDRHISLPNELADGLWERLAKSTIKRTDQ